MSKYMKCDTEKRLKNPEFKKHYQDYKRNIAIAVAVAKRREQLGLSQVQVAEKAGISQQLYSRFENCENVTLDTLGKILGAVKMTLVPKIIPES